MDIVKKHSVNDKINSFIREYNLNQQDESFLNELRNKIEVFVKKEKQIFLSDEQLVTRVQRLYTAAGGNVNALDLAMSIQDQASDVGGIDLNSHQLRLNETGGKINFNGPIDPAMLAEINGFSPVVLSITPMSDPKAFFGAVQ
jgi:hypothetical protein